MSVKQEIPLKILQETVGVGIPMHRQDLDKQFLLNHLQFEVFTSLSLFLTYFANDIWTVGDYCDFRMACEQIVHYRLTVQNFGPLKTIDILFRKTGRINKYFSGMVQGLVYVLSAPLVNNKIIRISVMLVKMNRGRIRSHNSTEFLTTETFFTAR